MLLVTGGWSGEYVSTTEIQVTRDSQWKEVAPYPFGVNRLVGATINNTIYMTGGTILAIKTGLLFLKKISGEVKGTTDTIYSYQHGADKWTWVGNMTRKLYGHAVMAVNRDVVIPYCT